MSDQFILAWFQALIALTVGLFLALFLRKLLRRHFTATHGYAIWLIVPALPLTCFIALMLPDSTLAILPVHAPVMSTEFIRAASASSQINITAVYGIIWLIGVVLHLGLQTWRQWKFVRNLGDLKAADGVFFAQSARISPALVGLFNPKVILPRDFAQRFNQKEQELIIVHENMHRKRLDHIANAACALLQSIFWFHPLLQFCTTQFRFDQELACDEAVMRQHKNSRKTYANAMLKSASFDINLPAACHWQSHQFLKERIMQLDTQAPRAMKKYAGHVLLACLVATATCLTWAAQSAPTPSNKIYDLTMVVKSDDAAATRSTVHVADGQTVALIGGEKGRWAGSIQISGAGSDSVKMAMHLAHADKDMGHPTVLAHIGELAKVKISDDNAAFEIELKASVPK